jgi:hypothetical protein
MSTPLVDGGAISVKLMICGTPIGIIKSADRIIVWPLKTLLSVMVSLLLTGDKDMVHVGSEEFCDKNTKHSAARLAKCNQV